jgi:YfiH family protein
LSNPSFLLDDRSVYRAAALDSLPWLEHGFGTARSEGWTLGRQVATVRQIHSSTVVLATSSGLRGQGDALISDRPDMLLAIRTADCLPILLSDTRNRAVAAIHAGWRGTVHRIVDKTVEALTANSGTRAEDLVAVIGPGIGPCCFEVGGDVAERFQKLFPERDLRAGEHTTIDLREANRRQLIACGIPEGQIQSIDLCTYCGRELFHSYRRDREAAGRMVTAIGIRPE